MGMLTWRDRSPALPAFEIGSEGDDGEHLRGLAGWPYSIYLPDDTIGGCDKVLCQGIQSLEDAAALHSLINAAPMAALLEASANAPQRPATGRPGDYAAAYAEETGIDYSTALVHCNMD